MPFWQFFREGRHDRALLVRPSRIPYWTSKNIFVLGCYEFLAMLEGNVRKGSFLGFHLAKKKQCVLPFTWSLFVVKYPTFEIENKFSKIFFLPRGTIFHKNTPSKAFTYAKHVNLWCIIYVYIRPSIYLSTKDRFW